MNFKAFCIVTVLFSASLSDAQDLSKKIDYTTSAVTMQRAFEDLSTKSGIHFYPQAQFENEIIILRLKDVPIKDAMKRIADTVGAEWIKKRDGYDLERSPEMAEKLGMTAIDPLA